LFIKFDKQLNGNRGYENWERILISFG